MNNSKQVNERLRIAQDLHDGIAQDLVALGYQFDLLLGRPDSSSDVRSGLRTARFRVDELITKIRREIFNLRKLDEHSLAKRIAKSGREICGEALSRCELEEVVGTLDQEEEIYMIACELLRNSMKHSGASVIEISLSQNQNRLYLEITDNGSGGAKMNNERFGLQGIEEKVAVANGVFKLLSNEEGTRAQVTL